MFCSVKLPSVLALLIVALAACAPIPTGSSVNSTALPTTAPTAAPTNIPPSSELPLIKVASVEVQIGVGSPIPVDAFISAELPDLCAQLAAVEVTQTGLTFEITMSVTPGAREECFRDTLPFRIAVPLNMVNQPEGTYTVNANGASTTFPWPSQPSATPNPALPAPISLARYQGPNPYRSSPQFRVDYDPSIWEFVEKDGSGREPRLDHRNIAQCSVWLTAGPMGAQPVATAQLAGYDWTIFQVQPDIIMYSIPWEDISLYLWFNSAGVLHAGCEKSVPAGAGRRDADVPNRDRLGALMRNLIRRQPDVSDYHNITGHCFHYAYGRVRPGAIRPGQRRDCQHRSRADTHTRAHCQHHSGVDAYAAAGDRRTARATVLSGHQQSDAANLAH